MSIEDTVLPRPYGPNGKPSLSSVEEGLAAIFAADVEVKASSAPVLNFA